MSENYLKSIGPEELERLGAQHEAWKPETHSFLREAGFADRKEIADFGSGPGFTSFDLAKEISPAATITSIDISEYYLSHVASRVEKESIRNLRSESLDITKPIDLTERFDAAFCRWFLAWVTKDLDTVLGNIYRSLTRGGVFASMEYLTLRSTVYSPPCAAGDAHIRAWEKFYESSGGNTEVGALLPERINAAGFKVRSMKSVGGLVPSGDRLFQWWHRIHKDFSPKFEEQGLLSRNEVAELNNYWERAATDPTAFIYTPVVLQIIAEK